MDKVGAKLESLRQSVKETGSGGYYYDGYQDGYTGYPKSPILAGHRAHAVEYEMGYADGQGDRERE